MEFIGELMKEEQVTSFTRTIIDPCRWFAGRSQKFTSQIRPHRPN